MRRWAVIAGLVWLTAAGLFVFGAVAGQWPQTASAYLCGWLVLISLPLGALPILMALEAMGSGETAVAAPLRLLLASLPILALLFVPVLVNAGGAYARLGCKTAHCPDAPYRGFGATWFSHDLFALRSVIYLIAWFGFSLYFLRPAKPSPGRRSLAVFGLMVHVVIGTLAAFDWFMSLDDGHVSANYGVLVMAAQCAFALTSALLMALTAPPERPDRRLLMTLVVVIGCAVFLQFVEYLTVWSANLPNEIVWYQDRAVGGEAFAVAAPVMIGLAALALAPERGSGNRIVCGCALAVFFVVEVVDLVLLASPNGLFVGNVAADMLAVLTLGGLAAGCATLVAGRICQGPAYG